MHPISSFLLLKCITRGYSKTGSSLVPVLRRNRTLACRRSPSNVSSGIPPVPGIDAARPCRQANRSRHRDPSQWLVVSYVRTALRTVCHVPESVLRLSASAHRRGDVVVIHLPVPTKLILFIVHDNATASADDSPIGHRRLRSPNQTHLHRSIFNTTGRWKDGGWNRVPAT